MQQCIDTPQGPTTRHNQRLLSCLFSTSNCIRSINGPLSLPHSLSCLDSEDTPNQFPHLYGADEGKRSRVNPFDIQTFRKFIWDKGLMSSSDEDVFSELLGELNIDPTDGTIVRKAKVCLHVILLSTYLTNS